MAKAKIRNTKKGTHGLNTIPNDLHQLEKIFELMEKHEVTELEWDRGSERLKIKTEGARVPHFQPVSHSVSNPAPAPQWTPPQPVQPVESKPAQVQNPNQKQVLSPFVGTFYRSPSPDSDLYVKEGQVVKRGDVLCIIEAMKLMNEIEAEFPGKVISVLVENGQAVEFGEPLFLIQS